MKLADEGYIDDEDYTVAMDQLRLSEGSMVMDQLSPESREGAWPVIEIDASSSDLFANSIIPYAAQNSSTSSLHPSPVLKSRVFKDE